MTSFSDIQRMHSHLAPEVVPLDPKAQWPDPDMTLLNPVKPDAPVMSDVEFAMVYGAWAS